MNTYPITLLTTLAEMGGLGTFIWFVFRSLRMELRSLRSLIGVQEQTLQAQRQTLAAMEHRVEETEKVGALYRKLIDDLPQDIDKYKGVLRTLKDQVIEELEQANKRKDDRLAELTRSRLDEIRQQEVVLEELPKLRDDLFTTFHTIEARLAVLDLFQPGTPLGVMLDEMQEMFKERLRQRQSAIVEVVPFDRRLPA